MLKFVDISFSGSVHQSRFFFVAATDQASAPVAILSTAMASVAALKKEWNACLSKAGSVGRCEKIEKDLRGVSKAEGVDSCVDETVGLMRCTSGSARGNGCSAQFLAMRECNRASGKQLVSEGGAYSVAPGTNGLFSPVATAATASTPPVRSLQGMVEAGQEMASSLGIPAGGVAF